MPRRTSSRLRAGAAAGAAAGASDGESSGSGGGGSGGGNCLPLPPSPGKRKARSPAEEDLQGGSLTAPAAVRCMSFQSPKKKALGGGIGDRFNAPLEKENSLLFGGGGIGAAPLFGDRTVGVGSFRLSAFSAFSQHAPKGTRRRSGEEAAPVAAAAAAAASATSASASAFAAAMGTSAAAPSSPHAPAGSGKGPMLPFLLAPTKGTSSPEVRRKPASRRPRRGVGDLAQSLESTTSSSSNGGTSSPALTPGASTGAGQDLAATPPRRLSRSGCPGAAKGQSGGGPAGGRVVGGARLGVGGGGGGDTMSEPDRSPHRSPIHRLTESLQKWGPGSRISSPADAIEGGGDGGDDDVGPNGGPRGASGDAARDGGAVESGAGGAAARDVGASWSGQELRRTLEKERLGEGRRRRHSAASAGDMYPHGRFGDHSPISPASSAGSITLGGFDAGTPASAGRPWRSSPSRADSASRVGSAARCGSGGAGSEEEFGVVRMEGSWSEEEAGASGTAMRLAFSPGRSPGARTPVHGESTAPSTAAEMAAAATAAAGAIAAADAATPSTASWQHSFSPVKGQQRRPTANSAGNSSGFLLGSSGLSRSEDGSNLATGRDLAASPDKHSIHSVRDLMDQGTDDEDDAGGGGGAGAALMRRRRRRPRPGRALRPLEMPDSEDATVVVDGSTALAAPAEETEGESATARKQRSDDSTPNPLVSPAFAGKGLTSDAAGFGSACTTAGPRWEGPASAGPLEASSATVAAADDSWIRGLERGSGRDWTQSTSGFGIGAGDEGQDASGALSGDNSGVVLGMSGLSGTDTSGASDTSTSFVKSRPIPDQSAFSSSRLSKGGAGAPYSPGGSSGGGSGGGPAVGPGPVCLTPRKSIMRCPPTPQRTPTWDGLEDSVLLEGPGSGGVRSAGTSTRHSLRRGKLLAGGGGGGSGSGSGPGGCGGSGGEMAIDCGLANSAGDPRTGSSSFLNPGRCGSARGGLSGRGERTRRAIDRMSVADTKAAAAEPASGSSSGSGSGALGFKHDFVPMGPIGEGGFSVVWKVRARGTGRLYAIKRSKREFRGRRDRDRCLLEARALKRLGEHPGVLRFERAWQEEGHFCLQTELCELGTLKDLLERLPSRRDLPETSVWQVLQDVGQALRHVHATGLVHLDVKPANLLIGDEGGRLKLADFGMATTYGDGLEGVGDGQEGDTLYMAKELLSSTQRLPSADMFSLGLTVYEVATRIELPGDGEDWHAMRDGRAIGLPASRSQELAAVIRQLMHPDPAKRPTADELCEHPRFSNAFLGANAAARREGGGGGSGGSAVAAGAAAGGTERDDYVVTQARAWRAAEAVAMDHPSSGLRTPTGDMSTRYSFQHTG